MKKNLQMHVEEKIESDYEPAPLPTERLAPPLRRYNNLDSTASHWSVEQTNNM